MFTIAILIVLLACAAIIDCRQEIIPNFYILIGLIIGFFYRVFVCENMDIISIATGVMIPVILLFPLFVIRAFGAGDIKLMSVVAMFVGTRGIVMCMFIIVLIGAVFALIKMIYKRNFRERFQYLFGFIRDMLDKTNLDEGVNYIGENAVVKRDAGIHFSLAIFLGTVIYMIMGGCV